MNIPTFKPLRWTKQVLNTYNLFIAISLFFVTFDILAQNTHCSTPAGPNILANYSPSSNIQTPVYIKVYFHVLQDDNGNGGVSRDQVHESYEILNQYFNPHEIYFVWDCEIDPIPNTFFFTNFDAEYCSIFNEEPHSDGIDVYIGPDNGPATGLAENVVSDKLIVGGQLGFSIYSRSPAIAHEVGHCLGLYHTFHGTFFEGFTDCGGNTIVDPDQEPECAGGTDGEHGDYVEDTEADPYGSVADWNINCQPFNEVFDNCSMQNFSPNENNIMSYNRLDCRSEFTTGQIERILDCVSASPVLQNVAVFSKAVSITSDIIGIPCKNDDFDINYEICLIGTGVVNLDINLEPPPSGVTYGGGFENNTANVNVNAPDCSTVTLTVSLDNSIPPGTEFDVILSAESNDPSFTLFTNNNCEKSINVGADASFTITEIGPCLYQFTGNVNGGSHEWHFGDGESSTEENPIHQYYSDNIYTITHEVTSSCDSDFATDQQLVACQFFGFDCACPSGGLALGIPGGEPVNLSVYSSQIDPQQSGCVAIAGHLIIDQSWTLSGAEVLMNPGAKLEVASGNELFIRGSHVHGGCGEMWEGIVVNENATLRSGNESLIEDAMTAVSADEGSVLDIKNTTFNRNLVGIASEGSFTLEPFHSNTFNCTVSLKPPLASQYSRAGIEVSDGSLLNIGVEGEAPNTFLNLSNGILANNTSLNVRNTEFIDIHQQDVDNYPFIGYGIRSVTPALFGGSGVTLTQVGFNPIDGIGAVSFQDCTTGIFARGVATTITDNNMTGMTEGIITKSASQKVVIRNNVIDCGQTGIQVSMPDPNNNNMSILLNTVTIDGEGDGILVNGFGVLVDDPKPIYVRDNTVNVNSAGLDMTNAIRVNSIAGVHVLDNIIQASSASEYATGIKLEGANLGKLESNTVTGLNPTGKVQGIWAYASPNHLWECNSVSGMRHGIRIDGVSNTPNMFTTNDMQDNETGLLMKLDGRIGDQFQTGNRWFGSFNSALGAARHEGNFDDISTSNFFSDNNSNTFWPPSIESQGIEWFVHEPTSFPIVCGISVPCENCEFTSLDNVKDSADESIATDGQPTTEAVKWQSERYLYGKLKRHTELAPSGSVFETFFGNQATSTVGAFSSIDDGVGSFYSIDPVTNAALEQNLAAMETKLDSIRLLDSLLVTATGNDSLAILATHAQLLLEINGLASNSLSLLAPVNSQRVAGAAQESTNNASIQTPQVYEQNEQSVNAIFLGAVAQGAAELKPQDVDALKAIAGQCPLEGGNAVFKARSLLALYGENALFDDDDLCQPVGQREGLQEDVVENTVSFNLFPNPARDMVELEWAVGEVAANQMQLRLVDAVGNVVSAHELLAETGSHALSTGRLAPGLYTVKVLVDGEQVHVEKLVLIK